MTVIMVMMVRMVGIISMVMMDMKVMIFMIFFSMSSQKLGFKTSQITFYVSTLLLLTVSKYAQITGKNIKSFLSCLQQIIICLVTHTKEIILKANQGKTHTLLLDKFDIQSALFSFPLSVCSAQYAVQLFRFLPPTPFNIHVYNKLELYLCINNY